VRDNDIDLESDELGGDLAGALGASLQPAILDRDIATLDPAEFPQPLHKSRGPLARSRRIPISNAVISRPSAFAAA
jgi:hypothetical protein